MLLSFSDSLSGLFFALLGVYLFFASSATKLHFFLGVFLHFITGDDRGSSSNKIPPPQGKYAGQMPAFRRVSGLIQPDVPRFLHRGTGLGPKQLSHVCHLLWLPWVIKFRDFHPINLIASVVQFHIWAIASSLDKGSSVTPLCQLLIVRFDTLRAFAKSSRLI